MDIWQDPKYAFEFLQFLQMIGLSFKTFENCILIYTT